MDILADINASRDDVVKACAASHDQNDIFNYEDILGKYDSLQALIEAWLNDSLGSLKLLTDRRLEAEIKLCETQRDRPEINSVYARWKFWETKLKNLHLLKGLIEAWHGDTLGILNFTVSI